MEGQPYPPPGSFMAKTSQRPASVATVQGGVPPYRVKETLVVNGKLWYVFSQLGSMPIVMNDKVSCLASLTLLYCYN